MGISDRLKAIQAEIDALRSEAAELQARKKSEGVAVDRQAFQLHRKAKTLLADKKAKNYSEAVKLILRTMK